MKKSFGIRKSVKELAARFTPSGSKYQSPGAIRERAPPRVLRDLPEILCERKKAVDRHTHTDRKNTTDGVDHDHTRERITEEQVPSLPNQHRIQRIRERLSQGASGGSDTYNVKSPVAPPARVDQRQSQEHANQALLQASRYTRSMGCLAENVERNDHLLRRPEPVHHRGRTTGQQEETRLKWPVGHVHQRKPNRFQDEGIVDENVDIYGPAPDRRQQGRRRQVEVTRTPASNNCNKTIDVGKELTEFVFRSRLRNAKIQEIEKAVEAPVKLRFRDTNQATHFHRHSVALDQNYNRGHNSNPSKAPSHRHSVAYGERVNPVPNYQRQASLSSRDSLAGSTYSLNAGMSREHQAMIHCHGSINSIDKEPISNRASFALDEHSDYGSGASELSQASHVHRRFPSTSKLHSCYHSVNDLHQDNFQNM